MIGYSHHLSEIHPTGRCRKPTKWSLEDASERLGFGTEDGGRVDGGAGKWVVLMGFDGVFMSFHRVFIFLLAFIVVFNGI